MKKHLHKFLTLVLILCCVMGMAQATPVDEFLLERFQVPVVTVHGNKISGSFLKWGSLVCIQVETLCQMEPGIHAFLSDSNTSLWLARDVRLEDFRETLAFEFHDTDVVMTENGIFVPFALAMEEMRLNPVVVKASPDSDAWTEEKQHGWLAILDGAKVDRLVSVMEEIYTVTRYNMHYWKDSDNYRFDVYMAEMTDAVRRLSLDVFNPTRMAYEGYREAFSKLMVPQEEDKLDFKTGADETLGMMNSVFEIGSDIADVFMQEAGVDLMGDMKKTYDSLSTLLDVVTTTNETLKVEEQVELFSYVHAMRSAEETIIRGLEEISAKTAGLNDWIDKALTDVMDTYKGSKPLWVQRIDHLGDQFISSLDNLIAEIALPHSYLVDLTNILTDFYLDTEDQASGTIEASRFLDIQTCCEQVFEEKLPEYRNALGQKKTDLLRNLIDVTNVYLLAGIRSQQAMSKADDLENLCKACIEAMETEQERMARFSEQDLQFEQNLKNAEEWLESLPELQKMFQSTENSQTIQHYATNQPLVIDILWQSEVDGKRMDIDADITGWTDDGFEIYRSPTEGEYTSKSGPVALHSNYGDWIRLEVFRHDTVMDVTVMYGDVMPFDAPSYEDANVEIQIYSADQIIADIAANTDACAYTDSPYVIDATPFLTRGAAGVWYFTFRLDHGVLRNAYDNAPVNVYIEGQENVFGAAAYDAQAELEIHDGGWVDEYYTPDGQLQSTKRYNGDGYLLESRWYENGQCTAYTIWDYDEWDHLVRISSADALDPEGWYLTFENIYSDPFEGELETVQLYNVAGTLLSEGATAADAADAVGMRMYVEESLPD